MNEVIAALDAGRDVDALEMLLERWRAEPAPALADVIDAVGARVDASRRRPLGRGARQKQQSWHELADRGDAADVGVLLATFADISRNSVVLGRLEKLAKRPADPRIAIALARLVEKWPVMGADAMTSQTRAVQLLLAIGDVRVVPIVEPAIRELSLGYARDLLALPHHRGPDVSALVAWLAAAPRPPVTDAAALLDAVYANPLDLGPRVVLADHLQQVGDPRGEFIALQLAGTHGHQARARRTREAELQQTYGRTWLGAIEPAVARRGLTFARGFLSSCVAVEPGPSAIGKILEAREWRTVEELYVTSWPALVARSPTLMPVLRRLTTRDVIPPHPHLEHVELETNTLAFANVVAPKLTSLHVESTTFLFETFLPFWTTRLAQQLTYFSIEVPDLRRWIEGMWPHIKPRGALERAVISSRRQTPWRFWLEADGALRVESVWAYVAGDQHQTALAVMLERLDRKMFTKIRFDAKTFIPPRLESAIKRFGSPP